MDPETRVRVEREVRLYAATPARRFPALRAEGQVDLVLLRAGAIEHPNPKLRWQCITLLDHLDGDAAVPVLVDTATHDDSAKVRQLANAALACREVRASTA